MRLWIWFTVAVLMLVDALGYTVGAIGPMRRALNPAETSWRKRLPFDLMLENQGLYLGAAMPLVGGFIEAKQRGAASALFGLALASCAYTLTTVPLPTPQRTCDPARARAVLIVIGFAVP